jgi:hypothetical protein
VLVRRQSHALLPPSCIYAAQHSAKDRVELLPVLPGAMESIIAPKSASLMWKQTPRRKTKIV